MLVHPRALARAAAGRPAGSGGPDNRAVCSCAHSKNGELIELAVHHRDRLGRLRGAAGRRGGLNKHEQHGVRGSREGWARGFTRRLRKESEKFSEACTAELFMA